MSINSQADLVAYVEKMPAFPKSVQRVLQLSADINVSSKDIVQVIETDPVMTIKILKVINSPFYGLPQKISSIQRAVVHIGINTIKSMALTVAAIGVLNPRNPAGLNSSEFLLHSLCTANICKLLGERLQIPAMQVSDYFVAGLLHDFGKMIFAEFASETYKRVLEASFEDNLPLHEVEMSLLGIDHCIAGRMLAEHWGFDQELIDAINHHHNLDTHTQLIDCLFAANQISKHLHYGFSGNPVVEAFPLEVVTRFGEDLPDLLTSLGDLSALKTEALSFINA
jgi:putative nucleotidyltransferase with HDIG domain